MPIALDFATGILVADAFSMFAMKSFAFLLLALTALTSPPPLQVG